MNGKIINDPVYGFLHFPEQALIRLIDAPWFQRLRRIQQMGMASLVYPGAVHTRFHHSLGATHLMGLALANLCSKGIDISPEDCLGAKQAILLHDVGHGPFSHGLERSIVQGVTHEDLSRLIMLRLNDQMEGGLQNALDIFQQKHPKRFLHKLVSSQLDMDRLDYLNRDSFYTGVSEGVVGYHRIIQMLTIHDGDLAIEEKGIHSVEKFLIARRLMYWQVYLHKTVLGAEQLVINILKRAKYLAQKGHELPALPVLKYFLYEQITKDDFQSSPDVLDLFCELDDIDILSSIKWWSRHDDPILSRLCQMVLSRKLYKVDLSAQPLEGAYEELESMALQNGLATPESLPYLLVYGTTSNHAYDLKEEKINILTKKGDVIDISLVDNAIIGENVSLPVKKFFLCGAAEILSQARS